MHEDASEVELDLEADVDIGSVDGRRPPKSKATVRNLIEPRPLGMCELLVLHRLLKATGLFPEKAFPGGKVGSLEKGVLEYSLDTAQSLDHVSPIIVQVPQLTIVLLVGPPKWVLFQDLVLFEVLSHPPAFVVGECEAVLLEERVDPWYTSVPGVV